MPSSPSVFSSPDAEHVGAFGRRLKALRRQAGLTRKDLAARAGMSPHHLNKVERGASGPSFGAIHALAKGLGIEPGLFFSGADHADISDTGLKPFPSSSRTSWPEMAPRIGLLALDQSTGRVIMTPSLSTLLGLDALLQDFSFDIFLERHVAPADRAALKLSVETLAAGIPVTTKVVRMIQPTGARIVVVLQDADWLVEQTAPFGEGLAEASPKDRAAWMAVVDVTHLDAALRDHSASQVGQSLQLAELIRERERCDQALEQESHARRQAERMMLDAQRLLHGLVHSARDALIILAPDLSVLDGNSELRRLCQGKCDPAKTCRLQDVVDRKALRRIKELAAQARKTGVLAHGEAHIDGHALELQLFPVLDATNKLQRLVLWMHDATQTGLQRDELRKQRLLLEKAE